MGADYGPANAPLPLSGRGIALASHWLARARTPERYAFGPG